MYVAAGEAGACFARRQAAGVTPTTEVVLRGVDHNTLPNDVVLATETHRVVDHKVARQATIRRHLNVAKVANVPDVISGAAVTGAVGVKVSTRSAAVAFRDRNLMDVESVQGRLDQSVVETFKLKVKIDGPVAFLPLRDGDVARHRRGWVARVRLHRTRGHSHALLVAGVLRVVWPKVVVVVAVVMFVLFSGGMTSDVAMVMMELVGDVGVVDNMNVDDVDLRGFVLMVVAVVMSMVVAVVMSMVVGVVMSMVVAIVMSMVVGVIVFVLMVTVVV